MEELLLRTRALNTIEIDAAARRVKVGAGVKAGELLAALEGTGSPTCRAATRTRPSSA